MRRSEIRDKITDAIDELESGIGDVLEILKSAEAVASFDSEAVSKDDVELMQEVIIEAIKKVWDLSEAVY